MSDEAQEVERALAAGDLVAAAAWYMAGHDLPPELGATLAAALDRARLDDVCQVVTWSMELDANLASHEDDTAEPREVPDAVDRRAFGQLADHWLARIRATPGDVFALAEALHCLEIAGRDAERPALVEQLVALDANTVESWLALAAALEEVQPAAATRAYDHALALDPDSSWILSLFSEHLRAAGDEHRADELAARAAALDDDEGA